LPKEAAPDGFYVLCTDVPAEAIGAENMMRFFAWLANTAHTSGSIVTAMI
jgi:hypothetical protein